jgi:hypothetical protein
MQYTFKELFNFTRISELTAIFYELTQIPCALIDESGEIVVGTGWITNGSLHSDLLKSCKCCIYDKLSIQENIDKKPYKLFKCPNSILYAKAAIALKNKHIAYFFIGHFFMDHPEEIEIETVEINPQC